MTENEAIAYLGYFKSWNNDDRWLYDETMEEFVKCCVEALEEIQQYREIGTVEECREAVEKQKAKKPRLNYKPKFFGKETYTCPRCGNCCLEEFANERQNNRYCWDCGQAINWEESE